MRKIVVITMGEETGICISTQLKELIGDKICIERMSLSKGIDANFNFKDVLVLISSPTLKKTILNEIPLGTNYIVARRIINYKNINKIINIQKDTEVLVVNDSKDTCKEATAQLIDMGLNHIKYYYYYPGIHNYKKLDLCITFGEAQLAPACIKKIIDIGSRYVDITTLIEILNFFNLMGEKGNYISSKFTRDIIKLSRKYNSSAKMAIDLKNMFETIIEHSNDAIVYLNTEGEIQVSNQVFSTIINTKINKIINKNISQVFPQIKNWKISKYEDELINIEEKNYAISKTPITRGKNIIGYLLTLENVSKIQNIEYKVRRHLKRTLFNATYTFDDIIGNSQAIIKVKKLAKKLSKSNSTILIYGESGTGKELFAQAIHNNSKRKSCQFVPINFAALSSSLLESELFGYEDGSFTGAKKGGKPGLFEMAHGGTIFLDEIGEAPIKFQTKLLRVIQERQVRRLGGSKLIPIDVRIIAATNKNLIEEIHKGNFRNDLFYRINVLPINIPSLRERQDDIPLLIEDFLKKFTSNEYVVINNYFEKNVIDFLKKYNWPGNIRELTNVIEYTLNIKNINIKINKTNLPEYIINNLYNHNNINDINTLINNDTLWLLKCIYEHKTIGRRRLYQIAKAEKLNIGESKIRRLLTTMSNNQLIIINKGVKGTIITEKGKLFLKTTAAKI